MARSPLWQWKWSLQTAAGVNKSILSNAAQRRLDFVRTSTPEAKLELELEHDDAYKLIELLVAGQPVLRCFRIEPSNLVAPDYSSLVARCRFAGILASLEESAVSNRASVVFRGVWDRTEGRSIDYVSTLEGAGDVLANIVAVTQIDYAAPLGITQGPVQFTPVKDATYDRKRIADAAAELASVFDFEVVPLADANGGGLDLGRLDIFTRQGAVRPGAIFGYGAGTIGNCTDATRRWTRPRNIVYIDGDEGLFGYASDGPSIAKHGPWEHREGMVDGLNQGILDARAVEVLQPEWKPTVTINPDPNLVDPKTGLLVAPVPGFHYWLGDTCPATIRKGAFRHDGDVRIDSIGIGLDDEGYENEHDVRIDTEDV